MLMTMTLPTCRESYDSSMRTSLSANEYLETISLDTTFFGAPNEVTSNTLTTDALLGDFSRDLRGIANQELVAEQNAQFERLDFSFIKYQLRAANSEVMRQQDSLQPGEKGVLLQAA